MTAFRLIVQEPVGFLLCCAALLETLGQIGLLILARRQRRGTMLILAAYIHLALGLMLLTLLLDGSYGLEYLPYQRDYPALVRAMCGLPRLAVAGLELAGLVAQAFFALSLLRYARRHPSAQSIKEAVDLLPAGVCVSEPEGTVLLSNLKMNEWNRQLTGGTLSDAQTLLRAVKEAGEPQGGKRLVRLADGTALLFEESELALGEKRYTQLTAQDVTEQFRVTKELEEKNARLRELQYRMKTYHFRETELLMRQEILSARTTVHNQLGGALLTGKYHLEHPESTDSEALRTMLTEINTYLLAEADEPEPRTDAYASARGLAQGIGVSVNVSGQVPASGTLRELLGQAIEECAANTVKHADGNLLDVTVEEGGFRISNNGAPPAGEIVPLGGLRSLQLAVEQAGGAMTLQSRPAFSLTVTLPHADAG